MFSGIVEDIGSVVSVIPRGKGVVLCVSTARPLEEIRVGDSLSVSGVCLSVTAKEKGRFFADVSAETLSRTTFKAITAGSRVNLERALSLSGRLDGHLVYGHVDGTGPGREVRHVGGAAPRGRGQRGDGHRREIYPEAPGRAGKRNFHGFPQKTRVCVERWRA